MRKTLQDSTANGLRVVAVVLLAVGAIGLSGFIAIDMLNMTGFLGFSVVAITSGLIIMSLASLVGRDE